MQIRTDVSNAWVLRDETAGANRVVVDTSGNLQFNSGYGSVATAYGCRAWVNFNGTGTVAIRASGNVTSITDNGVGTYTVNFTTAMPDADYSVVGTANRVTVLENLALAISTTTAPTTSSVRIRTDQNGSALDSPNACVAIFR
jgi:hypothetical protein